MKELIRHILKENRLQQEMKQFIEDNNIFDAAEMVGGLNNLKSIFKDDLEISEILNQLTGVVDFEYHDAFKDPRFVVFPIEYEIIGIEKNTWGTHSWPLLNLIYDESKLTSAEKKKLITILAAIQNDSTVGKIETNLPEIKNSGYFDVRQINGKDVDIHDEEFPFLKEDVKRIHNKLYGESESLNESKSEDKKLDLVKQMILQLFDEVEYIEIDEIYGNPLIKIYHDVEDTAANYDNWFEEVIEDKIDEMTGGNIILCSWWTPQWHYKRKNADFFIDVERIDYDENGNKINESEEKQPKYLDIIKDIVEPFKNEDCVCDIRVLYNEEDDMYLIDVEVGLFDLKEKFFAEVGRNHYVKKIRVDIKEAIKGYIPIDNFYVGSYSTPKCGEKRWWDKNINESDNKEQSLQKLIEQYGLYEFIKMTGLDFNQVKSIINKMDNPKEILKQYIREFVLEHDSIPGENHGSLFALNLPLSNTKYVNDILVQDREQIAVEIWEYHLDEYGHREQKDQYLTTINNLTNEELLSILSWMMEVIEGGYWD
jgi:hypothetical protein